MMISLPTARKMHIVADLSFIKPGINGGTQTYVDNLLPEMHDRYASRLTCLTTSTNHGHYESLALDCHKMEISSHNRLSRFLLYQKDFNRILRMLRCDVLFCPGNIMPLIREFPTVVTIHDMNHKDIAEYLPILRAWSYSLLLPLSAKLSNGIITPSCFSKERIEKHLAISSEKIHVIHHGISPPDAKFPENDWRHVKKKYDIKDHFICTINTGSPHKNTERLVRAFAALRHGDTSISQLVVMGHHFDGNLNRYIKNNNMRKHVISTGRIDDSERDAILRNSRAYIHPSLYEGFGFPLLEAQRLGVPVACSSTGSLPEICAGSAIYFDPLSRSDMTRTISAIVADDVLRRSLIERGYDNIKRFSWKKAAEETMDVLYDVYRDCRSNAGTGLPSGIHSD